MTEPALTLDEELIDELGGFAYDPLGFVMWAFPWGEPGELEDFEGPAPWQQRILEDLRDGLLSISAAILLATTSGHGVGKSAIVSWISWWAFSTRAQTRGVITANTENQLRTKTWVELTKWHRLFIAKHLFKCTATAIFSVDESLAREWRIDIVPWSERNTEAFAGLHNQGGRIVIIFDEASAIPDVIWETTEGALTDRETEIIWAVFGNPTRNVGRFRECFDDGKFARRWKQHKVDSREVDITNKEQIEKWLEDYGEDSDFFRVRVRGVFPRTDASSFIDRDAVIEAQKRPLLVKSNVIVLGVDVARMGTNFSVLYPRQGRDAKSILPRAFQRMRTTALAQEIAKFADEILAAIICIDTSGVGGGVADQLIEMGYNVYEVDFGSKPVGLLPGEKFANVRAEIWGAMRDWMPKASLPAHIPGAERTLLDELTAPQYFFNNRGEITLEPKEAMERRGAASPDWADALACTFATPVADYMIGSEAEHSTDYNPFDPERLYA